MSRPKPQTRRRRAAPRSNSVSTTSVSTFNTPMSKMSSAQASNVSSPPTSVDSNEDGASISESPLAKKKRVAELLSKSDDASRPHKKAKVRAEVYVEIKRSGAVSTAYEIHPLNNILTSRRCESSDIKNFYSAVHQVSQFLTRCP
jgi:hypothetical protein